MEGHSSNTLMEVIGQLQDRSPHGGVDVALMEGESIQALRSLANAGDPPRLCSPHGGPGQRTGVRGAVCVLVLWAKHHLHGGCISQNPYIKHNPNDRIQVENKDKDKTPMQYQL